MTDADPIPGRVPPPTEEEKAAVRAVLRSDWEKGLLLQLDHLRASGRLSPEEEAWVGARVLQPPMAAEEVKFVTAILRRER